MTSPADGLDAGPGAPGAGPGWHATPVMLAGYAAGTAGETSDWSLEAHLTSCARCRSQLSRSADTERLARNRSLVLTRVALGDGGRADRLLRRCGIPDHLLRLLAATPSLRVSWLLSVLGVLAVVSGEAVAVRYGLMRGGAPLGPPWRSDPRVLTPYLLVAPLLVLAGVAAAFLPAFDPAARLAAAAPFSGVTLLLVRTVCALAAALVPVVAAAFAVGGPGWLPAALLLPALALCALALAAATVMDPRAAVVTSGAAWAVPVLLLAGTHTPLLIVRPGAQVASAAVLCAAAVVLFARHDRFESGWVR